MTYGQPLQVMRKVELLEVAIAMLARAKRPVMGTENVISRTDMVSRRRVVPESDGMVS